MPRPRASLLHISRFTNHPVPSLSGSSTRAFHNSDNLLAKRAPTPSPRVRAAERQSKTSPKGRGWESNPNRVNLKLPICPKSFIAQAISNGDVPESTSDVLAFMKEWEEQLAENGRVGPWIESVVQKHNISADTLYALGTSIESQRAKTAAQQAYCSQVLISAAAMQGSRAAAAHRLFYYSNQIDVLRNKDSGGRYLPMVEQFANDGDRQCMTIFAMAQNTLGNSERAQKMLEDALNMPRLPYTSRINLRSVKPLSPSQLSDYYGAGREQIVEARQSSVEKLESIRFPGTNEAFYNLALLYKGQINAAAPRTSQSLSYFVHASALFAVAVEHLDDRRSTSQLLDLLPDDAVRRGDVVFEAAVHGDHKACWEMSMITNSRLHGQTQGREAISKAEGHVYPVNDFTDPHRNQTGLSPAVFNEKLSAEWRELAEFHDTLENNV